MISRDRTWVEPEDRHPLDTHPPHVMRDPEVLRIVSHLTAMTQSLGCAFSAAGFAVMLVTANCRLLFANDKAEDLMRRRAGVVRSGGRLAAIDRGIDERLRALVRQSSRPGRGDDAGGTKLELNHGNDRATLIAHIVPVAPAPLRMLAMPEVEGPSAAILVVATDSDFRARVRRFAARFGLTGAETRVLAEIISGSGLLAAAVKLEISEATARTHAKRIFEKTSTTRQTELVRLFFDTGAPAASSL